MSGACGCGGAAAVCQPWFDAWQGAELQLEFEARVSEQGQPLDFTGATATCVLKNNLNDPVEAAVLTATTENGGILNLKPETGKLHAIFTGDDLAELSAWTCGYPFREYYSQFAVRLASNQVVTSALYKVNLWAGTAMAPAAIQPCAA
jgi:hypothetical protein